MNIKQKISDACNFVTMSLPERLRNNPLREMFRWVRMILVAWVAYMYFLHLSTIEEFQGWFVALQFNIFKAIGGVLLFYLADRLLAHGPRAHNLDDEDTQNRNAVRIIGAAIVIGLAFSGQ